MINRPQDFIIVKGANATDTDDGYFGDLARIDLDATLVVHRLDDVLQGVDLAWLQECAAERDWIQGRAVSTDVATFSRSILGAPVASVARSVKAWSEKGNAKVNGRWVCSPEIANGGKTIECVIPLEGTDSVVTDLAEILDASGMLVKGPRIPIYGENSELDYYPMGNDITGSRVYALERAMGDFTAIVVDCGTPPAVQAETRIADEHEAQTLVGSQIILSQRREFLYDAEKKEWRLVSEYKLTARATLGLVIDFPRQRYGGRLLTTRVRPWYLVAARYYRPSVGIVQKWVYVRDDTVFSSSVSVLASAIERAIEAIDAYGFDMSDLKSEDVGLGSMCELQIRLSRVWCVAELRDEVVVTR